MIVKIVITYTIEVLGNEVIYEVVIIEISFVFI